MRQEDTTRDNGEIREQIQVHGYTSFVNKLWGFEIWLANTELYCAKHLYVAKGYECSLHYHKNKDETFYVLEGVIDIEIDDRKYHLRTNESIRVRPKQKHRFRSISDQTKLLEISTHHEDDDSYRLELSRKLDD